MKANLISRVSRLEAIPAPTHRELNWNVLTDEQRAALKHYADCEQVVWATVPDDILRVIASIPI